VLEVPRLDKRPNMLTSVQPVISSAAVLSGAADECRLTTSEFRPRFGPAEFGPIEAPKRGDLSQPRPQEALENRVWRQHCRSCRCHPADSSQTRHMRWQSYYCGENYVPYATPDRFASDRILTWWRCASNRRNNLLRQGTVRTLRGEVYVVREGALAVLDTLNIAYERLALETISDELDAVRNSPTVTL
jgi:hypothetical protein